MADPFQVDITTSYTVKYTTKEPVPISEIIDSLRSVERLIRRSGPFIESKYRALEVLDINVYVKTLESGSLKEELLVTLVFGSKENYEEAKKVLDKMMKDSGALKTVIALSVGALIGYGLVSCAGDNAKNTTAFYNNTIVNVGGELQIDAGEVKTILEAVTDKKRLARDAVDFVRPAKSDPSAQIENEVSPSVNIPANVIAEAPESYEPPQQDEKEVQYTNVPIVIYASDKDKKRQVWAGIVPGIVDSRIRFVLDEDVDPARLHGRTRVKADITLVKRFDKEKKAFESKEIIIKAVN